MENKKVVYVDMDGVLVDYYNAHKAEIARNPKQPYPQGKWGFFLTLKPLPGAIEAYKLLEEHFDVCILTKPSHKNVNCYTEKAQWIWDYLGIDALEKAVFSCDKARAIGDYLIDDQLNANQENFKGELVRITPDHFPDLVAAANYIIKKEYGV
jgi:5'(3')-deoxyribonucleotidase